MAILKVKFGVHQEINSSSSNMGIISIGRGIQPFFVISSKVHGNSGYQFLFSHCLLDLVLKLL